jgi:hypothetical protein
LYFYDTDHNELAIEKGVSAGYYLDRRGVVGFAHFDIDYGGVAQQVKFFVTDGTGGQKSAPSNATIISPLLGDNADGLAPAGANSMVGTIARLMGFNGATWDRLVSGADNGDAVASAALGRLLTMARLAGFNGASYDRLRSGAGMSLGVLFQQERGLDYGTAFVSSAALAANTPQNVLAAASNVNGVRLVDGGFVSQNAGGTNCSLLGKATAPATFVDGDMLIGGTVVTTISGAFYVQGRLPAARLLASGKRIDYIATLAETAPVSWRFLNYTVL